MAMNFSDLSALCVPMELSTATMTIDPANPDQMQVSVQLPVAQVLDLLMVIGGELPEEDEPMRISTDSLASSVEDRSSTDSMWSTTSSVGFPSRLVKRGLAAIDEEETRPKKMAKTRLQRKPVAGTPQVGFTDAPAEAPAVPEGPSKMLRSRLRALRKA